MTFRAMTVAALCAFLCLLQPALAQRENDVPVGVVSLAWGVVTIKHVDSDYKPARWLEPIYPGDQLRTGRPGSKMLVVFFADNHQEVMGENMVATVDTGGLSKSEGAGEIRQDKARNPFGAGGVENPFIYTHKLIEDDFKGADESGAIKAEQPTLRARVRPAFPPSFDWVDTGADAYTLQITQPTGELVWEKTLKATQYKLKISEANKLLKGLNYKWKVMAGDQEVVRPYEFKLLTLPLRKWFDEQAATFNGKRSKDKLQRSDWTDYLLVCSQVLEIDRVFELTEKMKKMDPNNPRIYRVLTRIYIQKGCPAHAKAAHDKLVELGGRDPVYP